MGRTVVRPVTAQHTFFCPACGRQVVRGIHRILKRFSQQDWVHARPGCLNSELIYDKASGKLL